MLKYYIPRTITSTLKQNQRETDSDLQIHSKVGTIPSYVTNFTILSSLPIKLGKLNTTRNIFARTICLLWSTCKLQIWVNMREQFYRLMIETIEISQLCNDSQANKIIGKFL